MSRQPVRLSVRSSARSSVRSSARPFALRSVALAAALAASLPAQALPVSWTNAGSSFWDIATNWSGNALPGAVDDVSLTLAGTRTVTYRQTTSTINTLAISGSNTLAVTGGVLNAGLMNNTAVIAVSGGTLNVGNGSSSGAITASSGILGLSGVLNATGVITMAGATLSGGTVQQNGASALVFTSGTSTLDGVTVRGALNIGDSVNASGRARVSANGLVVQTAAGGAPGVINVGTIAGATSATLGFTGTQTLNNVVLNLGSATQNATVSLDAGGTFTLGANTVVQGSSASFGQANFVGGTNNLVNNGTISANIGTRTLAITNSGALTNNGVLEARNGGILTIGSAGAWSNAGTVRVADASSTVNLGGTFSNTALASFDNAAGGNLNLTGTLNNIGATLSFSAATGSMRVSGGALSGGVVQESGSNGLIFTSSGGTLDGVTVRGTLNIGDSVNTNPRARVTANGLVVQTQAGGSPGVINLGTVAGATNALLGFTGTQTLDNVVLNLGNATQSAGVSLDAGGTLTVGANATVQGSSASFGSAQFVGGTNHIVNNGTISANIGTRTLAINNSGSLTNNGVLEARNGGTLTIGSTGSWSNAGTLRVADASSTVNLGGTFSNVGLGSFDNVAGGNLNLTGTLNNTGATLAFLPASGSMRLVGGTISGGTLQVSGANGLIFTSSSGFLDGVTVRGTLNVGDAANPSARVRIGANGIVVQTQAGGSPGVINLGTAAGASNAVLGFTGTQTLDNVVFNLGSATQNAALSLDGGGTFTLGANAVVQGSSTSFGGANFVGGTNNIVNNGTISANIATRTIAFSNSGSLTNNGVLEARNGGILNIGSTGAWINAGTVRVADASSTVNLGGTFSNGALGIFDNAAGGNLNLTGTLNNTAATLTFNATTGPMRLFGGTITGGTVQNNGTSRLVFTNNGGTLDGVVFRGDINLGDATFTSGRVRIGSNGITVLSEAGTAPGVINVGTATGGTSAAIGFTGTQTLDNVTVSLGNATQGGSLSLDAGGTFTLGANAVVQGSGSLGNANFVGGTNNFINNGSVSANVSARTLSVNNSGTVVNNGLLEARNGASLTLTSTGGFTNNGAVEARTGGIVTLSSASWLNAGTLRVVDATSVLNLGGSFTLAALGSLQNSAGGTVNLTGTLNNTATTLAFNATTGPMRLFGGTITGGTVQNNGASRLVFTNNGGTLDGVVFRGDLNLGDATFTSGRVRVSSNGITVLSEAGTAPGVINVGTAAGGTSAAIGFTGTQTLDNVTVSLGNATQGGSLSLDAGGTFTLGANAVVQGSGSLGNANFVGGTNNLVNNGTVSANISARTLTLNNNGTAVNNGLLEARNGASLTLTPTGGFTNNGAVEVRTGGIVTLGSSSWLNTGTLRVVDATSVLNLGGSFTLAALGSLQNGAGGTVNLTGTLNNTATTLAFNATTGPMRLFGGTITGGTVQNNGASRLVFTNNSGTLDGVVFRGDINLGDATFTSGRVRVSSNGITVLSEAGTAPGVINVGTAAGGTSAAIGFTGTQTLDNVTVSLGNATQGGTLSMDAGGTFTLGANAVAQGNGSFGNANFVGGTNNFINNGSVSSNISARTLSVNNTGTVQNNGTFDARNGGTLTISPTGLFTNFSGTTLTGGTYVVTGASILQFAGANIVTNAANIQLDGSASVLRNSTNSVNALTNLASNTSAGSFTVRNGRNFTTVAGFDNAGVVNVGSASVFTTTGAFIDELNASLQMAGGSFTATSLGNAGTVVGFGTVAPVVQNTGLVRASGGTLTTTLGVQGSGNITIDGAATLNLGSAVAANTVTTLADSGSLVLGSQNLNVALDYTNSAFGSGNSFAARAGVTGSGVIVGVNASQTLTGQLASTGSNTFVMDFGNVRGGSSATKTFVVADNGSGASIRGALQTAAPGLGSITDLRLSGSGVTAASFGAIAAGGQTSSYSVTLASGAGGALNGQNIAIVSNFGNVATQTLAFTGFTSVLAQGLAAPAGPLNLGSFRVGIAPDASASLSISNTTSGAGAERLGLASATTSGNFAASNALGSGLLAPGASLSNAIALNTVGGVAGVNSGSVLLQFTTNGALIDSSFTTAASNQQTVALSASGYVVAQPILPVGPINVGNYRVTTGSSAAFALTNFNLAPAGFQEALDVTAGATDAGVTLTGSISGLLPGATSSAMTIGLSSGGATGPRSGNAALTLVSNGGGSSGLSALALASQSVSISGTAYRLAVPQVASGPLNLAARVGDAAPTAAIAVSNNASDVYTEKLNASFVGTPSGFTGSGSIAGLAVNTSSSALVVALSTTTAGSYSGNAGIALVSSGAGTTGAADAALGTSNVALVGKVYAPAVAQVAATTVDFGTVRVGDALSARFVSVTNGASGSLTDTLQGSIGTAATPFTTSGSFSGLAAGATSSNALTVQLATTAAGVYNTSATVSFTSHDADLSDLALAGSAVTLKGQVNNLAKATLGQTAGSASLGGGALAYTLNFGTLALGGAGSSVTLSLANGASGPADALAGSWDLSALAAGSPFSLSGFGSFAGLAAGSATGALGVSFASADTGSFNSVLVLHGISTNGSGPDLSLQDLTLTLTGSVVAVPEPATYALMAGGLALLLRRLRGQRGQRARQAA